MRYVRAGLRLNFAACAVTSILTGCASMTSILLPKPIEAVTSEEVRQQWIQDSKQGFSTEVSFAGVNADLGARRFVCIDPSVVAGSCLSGRYTWVSLQKKAYAVRDSLIVVDTAQSSPELTLTTSEKGQVVVSGSCDYTLSDPAAREHKVLAKFELMDPSMPAQRYPIVNLDLTVRCEPLSDWNPSEYERQAALNPPHEQKRLNAEIALTAHRRTEPGSPHAAVQKNQRDGTPRPPIAWTDSRVYIVDETDTTRVAQACQKIAKPGMKCIVLDGAHSIDSDQRLLGELRLLGYDGLDGTDAEIEQRLEQLKREDPYWLQMRSRLKDLSAQIPLEGGNAEIPGYVEKNGRYDKTTSPARRAFVSVVIYKVNHSDEWMRVEMRPTKYCGDHLSHTACGGFQDKAFDAFVYDIARSLDEVLPLAPWKEVHRRYEAQEQRRFAKAEAEQRVASLHKKKREQSPEFQMDQVASRIRSCRNTIRQAEAAITEERQIGAVSGYVNPTRLHDLGVMIVGCQATIDTEWERYKGLGGTASSVDELLARR